MAAVTALALAGPAAADDDRRANVVQLCQVEAARQGLRPQEVTDQRSLRDAQGRVLGQEVLMRVTRDGRESFALCRYDAARGTVSVTLRRPLPQEPRVEVPSLRETERICKRAARDVGFNVDRVVRQVDVDGSRPRARLVVLEARRDGRDWRVDCLVDFLTGASSLSVTRLR